MCNIQKTQEILDLVGGGATGTRVEYKMLLSQHMEERAHPVTQGSLNGLMFDDTSLLIHNINRCDQLKENLKVATGNNLCCDCDEPIETDRFQANPDAVRCFQCQDEYEHKLEKEKRYA